MPFILRLFALTCALICSAAAAVETQLQVTATDDNLPTNRLTYTWSVRTSPQAATGANAAQISTPTSANSRVVLSVAGTYVFRVEVSDGHLSTTDDVTVVVNPSTNTKPSISGIDDQLIARNQTMGPIDFTITDAGGIRRVEWETSNAILVPGSAVELGETGAKRTIKIIPARDQSGTATITVKVTDVGGLVSTETFKLTVNVPPTITKIGATQTNLTLP